MNISSIADKKIINASGHDYFIADVALFHAIMIILKYSAPWSDQNNFAPRSDQKVEFLHSSAPQKLLHQNLVIIILIMTPMTKMMTMLKIKKSVRMIVNLESLHLAHEPSGASDEDSPALVEVAHT